MKPEAIALKIKLKPRPKGPLFDGPEDDEDETPEDSDPEDESDGDLGQMALDAIQHRDSEAFEEAIRKIVEACNQ